MRPTPAPTSRQISRRRLLQTTAAAGAAVFGCPAFLRAQGANGRLNVALIGCARRGAVNLEAVLGENIVALCDVNEAHLLQAAARAPRAKQFRDSRRLYDELRDGEFDAVIVSTTEHTHAAATLLALQRRKHVYCEKPLTLNVREARIITEAARQAGVATQMGTQNHAGTNYRRVVELIQAGAIGPVREVHVWVSRAWGWQTEDEARRNQDIIWTDRRPENEMPVPRGLDWDVWLGPAPRRPYHDVYLPGPRWYRWWDFGNGTMSDLGSHWIDLPWWALRLDAPRAVEADGPPPHLEIAPASMRVTYEYGPRDDRPAVRLVWYQGTRKPPQWEQNEIPRWPNGVLFIGARGILLSDYRRHVLLPERDFADYRRPDPTIPDSIGHHAEWVRACKTGAPTLCHFGYSGPLTEANHLGNVAYRAGRRIEWDTARMRIPNAPAAEQFLGREYRRGWSLG
jgi:predicted dehydrogenase